MHIKFKSIQSQFLAVSILVVLITLAAVDSIVSYQITSKAKNDFIDNSSNQMKIVEESINSFYSQLDQNINMMATNPMVMGADSSITSYAEKEETAQMTPSKNGGIEQRIYEFFEDFADSHPGTMYVYFGTESGSYLQWPETSLPAKFIPSEKGWYQAAIDQEGRIVRTDPYIDGISNIMITSNVRAFYDTEGKLLGTIGIDVEQTVISDMLKNMKTGKTGFSMILHNTGVILADGSNEENNFKNVNEVGIEGLSKLISTDLKQFTITINGTRYMVNPYQVEGTDWILVSFMSLDEINADAVKISISILIISVFILVITFFAIKTISRRITSPIIQSSEYLKILATGDFSNEIDSKLLSRKDEIGTITNAMNDMKNALGQLTNSVRSESEAIKREVTLTVSNVIELSNSIEDISATTEELAASMEETAASSQEISATSLEIEKAVHVIAERSQEGAITAGEIKLRAENTRNNVNEAQKKAKTILDNTKQKLEKAIEDAKVVNEISTLTQYIMQITEQTNLLSLNAAIEAARAGEAGHGFKVVADEIRKLADQSKRTAIQIQDLTNKVTGSVDYLTNSSNELLGFVSQDVSEDYNTMLDVAAQYSKDAVYVDDLVTDFSSTSEQLLASIEQILEAIEEVAKASNEGASGTTEIAEKAINISNSSAEVKDQVLKTNQSAANLMSEIAKYKI
jgi:methyl-accepting chemotaxis protein